MFSLHPNEHSINPDANKVTTMANKILEREATKKISILNDKDKPRRVPDRKGNQAICFCIITPYLSDKVKDFNLDTKWEWTPARDLPFEGEQNAKKIKSTKEGIQATI